MLDDIDSGRVNSILVRPITFYEFYLSQFVGYKLATAGFSFRIAAAWHVGSSRRRFYLRYSLVLLLILYYLVLVHTVSYCVACLAFFINKAQSFTAMKNLAIWVLAGELIPLDLYPEPFPRCGLMHSPFAARVCTCRSGT